MKRPPGLLKTLLFTLMAWVVVGLTLEGLLRLAGFGPPQGITLRDEYDKFLPDRKLIWKLKPRWSGRELSGAAVTTDSLGLRTTVGFAPHAKHRVLFLGDSVVFGHFLGDEETIPSQLQAVLAKEWGCPVAVSNAGVPGYSTFQQARLLRLLLRPVRPTAVLLGFCLNDVVERYTTLARFGGERFFMLSVDTEVELSLPVRLWRRSALRNALVRGVRTAALVKERYAVRSLWERPHDPAIQEAWDTTLGELDDLVNLCRRSRVPLAVVIFPFRDQLAKPDVTRHPQDRLLAHLAAREVPALDLLPALAACPLPPDSLFLDSDHFSARGCRLVAQLVASFLVAGDLLGGEPAGG